MPAEPAPSTLPFWWLATPLADVPAQPLPAKVDVAIVGGGYAGLSAALVLARAGRAVAVLEQDQLGSGASSRNGGMVGGGVRLDLATLARRYGAERARRLADETRAAFDELEDLLAAEQIAADYRRSGRFHAACNPRHFRRMRAVAQALARAERAEVAVVPRADQRREIGSDLYHGGLLIRRSGGLDPAKYHAGLLARAGAAGAMLIERTAVRALRPNGAGFEIGTSRGELVAGAVLIATNGYTGPATPGLQRRIVPVGSYMIATEPLPPALVAELDPQGRMFVDSNRLLAYFRLSPDRRRVLFGGRLGLREVDERTAAAGLRARLGRVWPALRDVPISHAWKGFLGFTFDHLPHCGRLDGLYYALGCNGSGVAMATYLGRQMALEILGRRNRPSVFETLALPGHPLYRGRPWFLPLLGAWYRWQDRLDAWRG